MKITMLYTNSIAKIIKEHGYTWKDMDNIHDYAGRVKFGDYGYTLEEIFYSTNMGGFDENGEHEKILVKAFLQALEETKMGQLKPCRYCGKKNIIVKKWSSGGLMYMIKCNNPNCPLPTDGYPNGENFPKVKEEWNRRNSL